MSNRSSHFVHRLQALPSALAGVSGSGRLLALAAVLALLALTLLPTTAQAQTVTEVWSETLPVKDAEDDDIGCHNGVTDTTARCSNSLTDDTFEYDNTNYSVTQLYLRPHDAQRSLVLTLNTTPTAATIADLTLNVDGEPFPLSNASLTGSSFSWANSGLTWTIGTDVTVTLTATPTVAPDDVAVVPHNWPPIPTGVLPGQQFRLIFLTSTTRDASSTDIDDYNTFIQGRAAAGNDDIREYQSGFRVVGSTADVDARDNTATTGTGVAIYWLNGNKVADNYGDFYDGGWNNEAAPKDEWGNAHSRTGQELYPATGSRNNGTEDTRFGGRALGATEVRAGQLNLGEAGLGPLQGSGTQAKTDSSEFYGLSQILQVEVSTVFQILPDELPEPVDPPPLVVVPPGKRMGVA